MAGLNGKAHGGEGPGEFPRRIDLIAAFHKRLKEKEAAADSTKEPKLPASATHDDDQFWASHWREEHCQEYDRLEGCSPEEQKRRRRLRRGHRLRLAGKRPGLCTWLCDLVEDTIDAAKKGVGRG